MKSSSAFLFTVYCIIFSLHTSNAQTVQPKPASKIDRTYILEATMLGYITKDGTRNPVLRAKKGERVRIQIVNGERMTHDIALEKAKIKSATLIEKGTVASITFIAKENDTYFCTIPGHRAAGMVGSLVVTDGDVQAVQVDKGLPAVLNGRALNFGFESGNLSDWSVQGDSFRVSKMPSPYYEKGVTLAATGRYFVTSGGTKNYKRVGSLTSVSFKVRSPYASFRVSGGSLQDTRVELALADNDSVFFQISGSGRFNLRPVVVDLRKLLNKMIYIRLVDNETGISTIPYIKDTESAHLSFDDFRFHTKRPVFPNELKPSDIVTLPPLDIVPHAGLSGIKAAEVMTLPPGFSVALAASEPDIVKPIAFTMDWKGRLWVVESHTYPVRAPEGQGQDKIWIFEDSDGDGTLDKKKLFSDGLNLVSGIEVGMGGVWLGAPPYLLFIPIDPQTDKPAGPAQTILDGWGYQDTHETLNTFQWGPDGWLYGTQGVFTESFVGRPGAPDSERVKFNAGVWRLHPITKRFELFAEGTSNPWGIDFNDYGHPFITACVIPHLYHIIQGARYVRQSNPHPAYTYDDIKTIADHVHWEGNNGPHAGNLRSGAKGGGHAHVGAMIYLGGNNWPAEYRNDIFMNNIHGSRVNIDKLSRKGSGYAGAHGKDFLLTNDSWSQWLNFRYGPTGSVYAIDWYDKNQCHSPNPDVHDKTMGRIFRISNDKDEFVQADLSKATDMELVNYQLHPNDWYVRQARLILQQRGPNTATHAALKEILRQNPDITRKLRALWALHVTRGLSEAELAELLSHENEYLRSWAIQLLNEDGGISDNTAEQLLTLAKTDSSALVRLYLASALQHSRINNAWDIIAALYQREEDKDDHNIPLMLWYAFEPMVKDNISRSLDLAMNAKIPNILLFTIQRVKAIGSPESKKALQEFSEKLRAQDQHYYHEALKEINR